MCNIIFNFTLCNFSFIRSKIISIRNIRYVEDRRGDETRYHSRNTGTTTLLLSILRSAHVFRLDTPLLLRWFWTAVKGRRDSLSRVRRRIMRNAGHNTSLLRSLIAMVGVASARRSRTNTPTSFLVFYLRFSQFPHFLQFLQFSILPPIFFPASYASVILFRNKKKRKKKLSRRGNEIADEAQY